MDKELPTILHFGLEKDGKRRKDVVARFQSVVAGQILSRLAIRDIHRRRVYTGLCCRLGRASGIDLDRIPILGLESRTIHTN